VFSRPDDDRVAQLLTRIEELERRIEDLAFETHRRLELVEGRRRRRQADS
jgi:hypothetical protein